MTLNNSYKGHSTLDDYPRLENRSMVMRDTPEVAALRPKEMSSSADIQAIARRMVTL